MALLFNHFANVPLFTAFKLFSAADENFYFVSDLKICRRSSF